MFVQAVGTVSNLKADKDDPLSIFDCNAYIP